MRDVVLGELRMSCAVVLAREEVVPRFRVLTPEGEWSVFVPLPDDLGERMRRLRLVHGFLAWKSATAFVLSTELREPDCVLSAGVARSGVLTAARPIIRKPLGLGAVEWLPESAVGEEVVALLPRGRVLLDVETEAELMRVFGVGGEFEVRKN